MIIGERSSAICNMIGAMKAKSLMTMVFIMYGINILGVVLDALHWDVLARMSMSLSTIENNKIKGVAE